MRQFPSSLNNLNKVNTSFNKRNIFIPKNYKNFKKKKRNNKYDSNLLKNKDKNEKNALTNSTNTFQLLNNKDINIKPDK